MKKILLAIMAIASITLVSCKDRNNPEKPEANKKFVFEVTKINYEGAHVKVTAKDSTIFFFVDAISVADLEKIGSDSALYNEYAQHIEKNVEKGIAEYDFNGFPEDTEMAAFAFQVDSLGALVGKVETFVFKTTKFASSSTNTFTFEKKDSIITITPSNLEEDYAFCPMLTAAEIAQGNTVISVLKTYQPIGLDKLFLGKGIMEISLNDYVYAGSYVLQVCPVKITKEIIDNKEMNNYERIGKFTEYAYTYTVEEGAKEEAAEAPARIAISH